MTEPSSIRASRATHRILSMSPYVFVRVICAWKSIAQFIWVNRKQIYNVIICWIIHISIYIPMFIYIYIVLCAGLQCRTLSPPPRLPQRLWQRQIEMFSVGNAMRDAMPGCCYPGCQVCWCNFVGRMLREKPKSIIGWWTWGRRTAHIQTETVTTVAAIVECIL